MSMMKANQKKFKHFINTAFSFEFQGVRVDLDDKGKMKLIQEHDDETFDEINCTPALINRIIMTLKMTRKEEWRDYPYKEEE